MKFLGILAAASIGLSPVLVVAQDAADSQVIGVPPQTAVPETLPPIPPGTAAFLGFPALVAAGLGAGLAAGGGGGGGATGTTSTTSTVTTN